MDALRRQQTFAWRCGSSSWRNSSMGAAKGDGHTWRFVVLQSRARASSNAATVRRPTEACWRGTGQACERRGGGDGDGGK